MSAWWLYLATGAFSGVMAGLLGVGGGLIIVPVLSFIFVRQHFAPAYIVHLALGTSLATIMFTSISSVQAHHWRAAVAWRVIARITPGIVLGTLLGTFWAANLSASHLKLFFVIFVFYAATQMILDIKPKAGRSLPGALGMFIVGSIIGCVSGMVGIGGGTLSVPFLLWGALPMRTAIGTSAAIGFPIAVAGALGYVLNGLKMGDLPAGSLGFVYLPALAGLAIASVLVAPLGAKLAHQLPVARLKKIFGVFLYVVALRMLIAF